MLTQGADQGEHQDHRSDGPTGTPSWYRPPTPFEPGNTAAVSHGAYSPKVYEPRALELASQQRMHMHWLTPADEPALWAWAKCEAQIEAVEQWLTGRADETNAGGMLDSDGDERGATKLLLKLQGQAANHRSRLGLDPLSRARLTRDVAASQVDVARLMATVDDQDVVDVEAVDTDA